MTSTFKSRDSRSIQSGHSNGVEAVERALTILKIFQRLGEQLSLAEVAKRTGFYKSTILRLAISLERMGFVVRNTSGEFKLGPELPRLASLYESGFNLENLIRPELLRLVDVTRETAAFYVLDGEARVCKFRENSPRTIRHHLDEGARLPLNAGAGGKILSAFSSLDSQEGQDIRKKGWYVSIGERDAEAAAIAVPLLDFNNRLWGALSVSGLRTRFTDSAQKRILRELKISAENLSKRLPVDLQAVGWS